MAAKFLLPRDQASLDLSRPLGHLLRRGEGREYLGTIALHTAATHNLVLYKPRAEEWEEGVSLMVMDEDSNLLDAMVATHVHSPRTPAGLRPVQHVVPRHPAAPHHHLIHRYLL